MFCNIFLAAFEVIPGKAEIGGYRKAALVLFHKNMALNIACNSFYKLSLFFLKTLHLIFLLENSKLTLRSTVKVYTEAINYNHL